MKNPGYNQLTPSPYNAYAEICRQCDAQDQWGIGDVNSDARGSGARYNAGKPPMELLPLRVLAGSIKNGYGSILTLLADFHEGEGPLRLYVLIEALSVAKSVSVEQLWRECAHVFGYGAKKYAAWNWAKGMAWSIPLACAVRHLLAMSEGEELDPESGLPHRGHVMCNIVMLLHFQSAYPEGDDRPVVFRRSEGFPVNQGDTE